MNAARVLRFDASRPQHTAPRAAAATDEQLNDAAERLGRALFDLDEPELVRVGALVVHLLECHLSQDDGGSA